MVLSSVLLLSAGCSRFHPRQHEYVYVAAREVYLRDRVAAVSNRVALVKNGQKLEVVEHGRRFDKVRTADGKVGWLQEHTVVDQQNYDRYQQLATEHAQDPAVASAQLRDDLYLHILPGRQTDHFYLLAGNSHVQLLQRASVPHVVPGAIPAAKNDAPPPMEDWWLVRDSAGNTGWLLGSRVDVDIPDAIGEYAEGQRMVAAYPLATVMDDGRTPREQRRSAGKNSRHAGRQATVSADADAQPTAPATPKPETEYLVLLAPPQSGLPYDFDQIRVFTWSLNHHRYETAYRLRGFQGFLPVTLTHEEVDGQSYPAFHFRIAGAAGAVIDPTTGIAHPQSTRTVSFRLEGNILRRTGADQDPIETRKSGAPADQSTANTARKHAHEHARR